MGKTLKALHDELAKQRIAEEERQIRDKQALRKRDEENRKLALEEAAEAKNPGKKARDAAKLEDLRKDVLQHAKHMKDAAVRSYEEYATTMSECMLMSVKVAKYLGAKHGYQLDSIQGWRNLGAAGMTGLNGLKNACSNLSDSMYLAHERFKNEVPGGDRIARDSLKTAVKDGQPNFDKALLGGDDETQKRDRRQMMQQAVSILLHKHPNCTQEEDGAFKIKNGDQLDPITPEWIDEHIIGEKTVQQVLDEAYNAAHGWMNYFSRLPDPAVEEPAGPDANRTPGIG